MKRSAWILSLGLVVVLFAGCMEDRSTPAAPEVSGPPSGAYAPEAMASELVEESNWLEEDQILPDGAPATLGANRHGLIDDFDREVISGDVVHYSATIRTGPGPYDRIGIHRVVRERRPYLPIRTQKALFLLHGDLKTFEGMWIPGQYSPNLPDDFGLAVHLARAGVDVWGIDQSWNFVPLEEVDFSFFRDWGIQKEADHLSAGVAVTRLTRWLTGNGLDKMLLLGYSSGCVTGYALLNEEAQRPLHLRQVSGFIAADCGVRSDSQDWIDSNLLYVDWLQSLYDAGQYQDALITREVANLARTQPEGESPFAQGFTNLQYALYLGGGQIWPPTAVHYHAPVVESGFPVDFQFITIDQWIDFLENTAAYEPILFELEYNRLFAMFDSPYVSHLSQVTVPVLDIGGAGGIAPYTAATVSYLGSTDITQLYVSTGAPEPALDYGHIDIFTGSNAPELVWQPILDWVEEHSHHARQGVEEIVVVP